MSELLSCPFCGGEAKVYSVQKGRGVYYEVACGNVECIAHWQLQCDEQRAITAWNTRHVETCQLIESSWDNGTCTWGVICSACGAKHEHETGASWNYAPCCGRKVVEK